jgi:solute carrier family 25 carnitine/acylcarnitine transporter 20/29
MIPFLAGFAYGITNVVVGQPLDTIKTRMQAMKEMQSSSMLTTAREIVKHEGIRGLYRGGVPLVLGGGIIRSTQFGVYNETLYRIREQHILNNHKWLGFINTDVVIAGLMGGFCRGLVESPIEFMKVRRQCEHGWKFTEMLSGTGSILFHKLTHFSLNLIIER